MPAVIRHVRCTAVSLHRFRGRSNKPAELELAIGETTVEAHGGQVRGTMQARSVADRVRTAAAPDRRAGPPAGRDRRRRDS